MHRSPVTRRTFASNLPHLVTLFSLAAGIACGSSGGDTAAETDGVPAAGATSTTPGASSAGTGGTASTGAPSPTTQPSTSTSTSTSGGSTNSAPISAAGSATTPASTDAVNVGDVCQALGSDDACAACVCGACTSQLDDCAGTPGCSAILACVRDNGCKGTDCYCGDARLTQCFRGGGNGPCKDVVLAAPGGREPTIADPSGGPASDAALHVADCADDGNTCGDVCDIGG